MNMDFKIYHNDDFMDVIDRINNELKNHGLAIVFVEENEVESYDVYEIKRMVL